MYKRTWSFLRSTASAASVAPDCLEAFQNCFWAEYLFIGHILNRQSVKTTITNERLTKITFHVTQTQFFVNPGIDVLIPKPSFSGSGYSMEKSIEATVFELIANTPSYEQFFLVLDFRQGNLSANRQFVTGNQTIWEITAVLGFIAPSVLKAYYTILLRISSCIWSNIV